MLHKATLPSFFSLNTLTSLCNKCALNFKHIPRHTKVTTVTTVLVYLSYCGFKETVNCSLVGFFFF